MQHVATEAAVDTALQKLHDVTLSKFSETERGDSINLRNEKHVPLCNWKYLLFMTCRKDDSDSDKLKKKKS